MRTLIYKRTHCGDPDPEKGVFGNKNCMKTVRAWGFKAVIGIGGIGNWPEREGIARKLTWIGIGAQRTGDPNLPCVRFNKFMYYGPQGPLLEKIAPALARHMYSKNVRTLMDSLSPRERKEVDKILDLARDAPPSGVLVGSRFQKSNRKCRPKPRPAC